MTRHIYETLDFTPLALTVEKQKRRMTAAIESTHFLNGEITSYKSLTPTPSTLTIGFQKPSETHEDQNATKPKIKKKGLTRSQSNAKIEFNKNGKSSEITTPAAKHKKTLSQLNSDIESKKTIVLPLENNFLRPLDPNPSQRGQRPKIQTLKAKSHMSSRNHSLGNNTGRDIE